MAVGGSEGGTLRGFCAYDQIDLVNDTGKLVGYKVIERRVNESGGIIESVCERQIYWSEKRQTFSRFQCYKDLVKNQFREGNKLPPVVKDF